jgi:hypothetical protein
MSTKKEQVRQEELTAAEQLQQTQVQPQIRSEFPSILQYLL